MVGRAGAPDTVPTGVPTPRPHDAGAAPFLEGQDPWSYDHFAGRLCELSAFGSSARLTLACGLLLQAQQRSEPTAWITGAQSCFFPPDVAAYGIDLEALAVVRANGGYAVARAADHLIRSGAFGLVVIDVDARTRLPAPAQTRLLGLAKKHATVVLYLTEKTGEAPSVSPLVSLRARAQRTRAADNRFCCTADVIKDKRRGPGWSRTEIHRGPPGLR